MRAGEWWNFKLVPIAAAFYGTALTLGVAAGSLWRAGLSVLLALVPGAIFVSVINDVTDRADDRAAGKPNRAEGWSRGAIALLIAGPAAAGGFFVWLWRDDRLVVSCYLAAWLAFSLYSLPPFRFKTRGLPGVLCDAGGAHLFPTLVAVLLAYREAQSPPSVAWLVAVALWSGGYGLRGILWHQLSDRENDHRAGVRTFAERHDPAVAARFGTFVAFPLEMAGLTWMLWQMASVLALVFLLVYAIVAARKMQAWRMKAVLVAPRARYLILLHDYYLVFLPVALLATLVLRDPRDAFVAGAHLVLFSSGMLLAAEEMWQLRPRPVQKR